MNRQQAVAHRQHQTARKPQTTQRDETAASNLHDPGDVQVLGVVATVAPYDAGAKPDIREHPQARDDHMANGDDAKHLRGQQARKDEVAGQPQGLGARGSCQRPARGTEQPLLESFACRRRRLWRD